MQLPRRVPVDPYTAAGTAAQTVLAARAAVDSSGALAVHFPARDLGYLVRRIVVQGVPSTTARVYVGEPGPLAMADGTTDGLSDVADYAQPLYVPPATPLVFVWTLTADGSTPADPQGATSARAEIQDLPGGGT